MKADPLKSRTPLGGSVAFTLVAVTATFLIFAWLSAVSSTRSSVPASACEGEFRRVAAIDDLHDTVTDLDLAVQVCESVAQWEEMSAKYPAAVEPGIALIFLTNRCRSVGGPLCGRL